MGAARFGSRRSALGGTSAPSSPQEGLGLGCGGRGSGPWGGGAGGSWGCGTGLGLSGSTISGTLPVLRGRDEPTRPSVVSHRPSPVPARRRGAAVRLQEARDRLPSSLVLAERPKRSDAIELALRQERRAGAKATGVLVGQTQCFGRVVRAGTTCALRTTLPTWKRWSLRGATHQRRCIVTDRPSGTTRVQSRSP